MAAPSSSADAVGHAHMLSADQFASHGTSPVSTFSQGVQDGRAQAPAQEPATAGTPAR